jgi:hypothetical protein
LLISALFGFKTKPFLKLADIPRTKREHLEKINDFERNSKNKSIRDFYRGMS